MTTSECDQGATLPPRAEGQTQGDPADVLPREASREPRTVRLTRALVDIESRRREYEKIAAATWVRSGLGYAEAGRRLGLDRHMARDRALAGEKMLQADPAGARRLVSEYLRSIFTSEDPVQKLAAVILADGPADALRAAADLFEQAVSGD